MTEVRRERGKKEDVGEKGKEGRGKERGERERK